MQKAWQEFIDGNDTSFSLIYNTYYKKMIAYGIAIGFCEHLCKDAVQDVFYTICHSRKKLGYVEKVESYLLHCLKNRLFDIYKIRKNIECLCLENSIIDQDTDSIGKIINEENQLLIKGEIERLFKKLKPEQMEVVYCRFYNDLKFNEIAILMNMSTDAVKKLLYRTLKIMSKESKATSAAYNYFP